MVWAFLPLCAALCAIGFRIRGGLTEGWAFTFRGKAHSAQLPGQVSRLVGWGGALALSAGLYGVPWLWALSLAPLGWLGAVLPLWDTIDMGRNQGSFLRDFSVGVLHGVLLMAPVSALLWWLGYAWWFALGAGALWSCCYALAWWKSLPVQKFHLGKDGSPPETAELLFGALAGLALGLAILFA